MFERFTEGARRVLAVSSEEARRLNRQTIDTEHLLLGLTEDGDSVAAQALEALGISLGAVRQQVDEVAPRGPAAKSGYIPLTQRAKKVLELTLREALQLGDRFIGVEHLLLGLLAEGGGVAAQVLGELGADARQVRERVIQIRSQTAD